MAPQLSGKENMMSTYQSNQYNNRRKSALQKSILSVSEDRSNEKLNDQLSKTGSIATEQELISGNKDAQPQQSGITYQIVGVNEQLH